MIHMLFQHMTGIQNQLIFQKFRILLQLAVADHDDNQIHVVQERVQILILIVHQILVAVAEVVVASHFFIYKGGFIWMKN